MASAAMASKTPAASHSQRALPRRGIGNPVPAEAFRVLPRTARREPHENHIQAVPVQGTRPATPQRMGLDQRRDERLEGCPDGIEHFGVERAHDGEDLHLVVGG